MADTDATLRLWSTTASSNKPAGSTSIGANLDDNLRVIQQVVRQFLAAQATNMASAATVDLATADGFYIQITGTTTITAFGTEGAGIHYLLKFAGALTLTHNATSLILPGGVNIVTAAGDMAWMISEGSGNWRCLFYSRGAVGPSGFVTGTRMLFQQTTAPTGWTKEVSAAYNDAALRFTTGTVGTGGADAFNTLFGTAKSTAGFTLTTAEMPAHKHSLWPAAAGSIKTVIDVAGQTIAAISANSGADMAGAMDNTGGGGSHSHTLNNMNLKWADCIIATKD